MSFTFGIPETLMVLNDRLWVVLVNAVPSKQIAIGSGVRMTIPGNVMTARQCAA